MNPNEITDSSDDEQSTPPDILEAAKAAAEKLLPSKSAYKYKAAYKHFVEWQISKKTRSFSEDVLIVYFSELSQKIKPSTLWSQYSMLKSTVVANNNINISTYPKLLAFLKRQSEGYRSKKSKVLTSDEVEKFLNEAPDHQFLATKVALILGITGACRREELCNITMKDIEHHGKVLLIRIPITKTKIQRSFTVEGEFYEVIKRYEALRPKNVTSDRFFLNFQKGKCTTQVIGKNKFGNMPRQIAEYLNLPDAKNYTGHSFRRTSATLLADAGADITTLKRHGGWKSNQVAESYIEDSVNNKRKICNQITESVILKPSTSNINLEFENTPLKRKRSLDKVNLGASTSRISESPPMISELKSTPLEQDDDLGAYTSKICDSSMDKENVSSPKVIIPGKNISLQITHCSNVTFQFIDRKD